MISLLPCTLIACAGSAKAPEVRKEVKEEQLLHDSARLHWEGRRWNDSVRAAKFIEDAGRRVLFQDWMETELEDYRIVDFTLLEVEISPEDPNAPEQHKRTGKVWVRVEGYALPAQILEREKVSQEWYRSSTGWWVEWEPPEEDSLDED